MKPNQQAKAAKQWQKVLVSVKMNQEALPEREFFEMIPEFNDIGYLPPGVHLASLEEIASRFGQESEIRRAQMDSIRWLVELAKKSGVQRIIINGSFVTDVFEPNDVDCAMLLPSDFPLDPAAAAELSEGLPFVDLHMVEAMEYAIMVEQVYASDRDAVPKGVIEVLL
ncbi:MAG: hypothetical protein JNJ77_04295 [Planctomycetia bacterium]|nr:hypothetical protein [Planctomycetia bacterium]